LNTITELAFFHITPAISINGFSAEQHAGNRGAHNPVTVV
jgi:hypothetical protein